MARAIPTNEKPQGFEVVHDFLSGAEERALLQQIEALEYRNVEMYGVVARRTVHHYGWHYGYENWRNIERTEPLPDWLVPFRDRAASWVGVEPATLEQALVSRYPPGAGIGWHRDAPMFGPMVVGISLGAPCRFYLRREIEGAMRVYKLELPPRSAYVLAGEARTLWQHHVPPVKELRYSISLRTVKDPARWDALSSQSDP